MPRYAYRCDGCGSAVESNFRGDRIPCGCGLQASRRFVFQLATSFQPHFNAATGAYVTSKTDFEDKLKLLSETTSEKTGVFTDYQPVDMSDAAACGLTPEDVAEVTEARAKAGAA